MECKDLRIGNFINITNRFGTIVQIEINGISIRGNVYDEDDSAFSRDEIQPIELTEDWITKFGGYKVVGWDDMEFYRFDKEFDIYMFELEILDDGFYFGDTKIEYVHDLQNCYYFNYNQKKELSFENIAHN